MTASFKNQTLESAADYLAHRKVGLRHNLVGSLDKQAFDLSSTLSSVGDWYKSQSPTVQKSLIGAGIGGTLGLGSSLFKRPERRNMLRDSLTGALAGGIAGGGLGLVQDRQNLASKAIPGAVDSDAQEKLEDLYELQREAQPSLLHRAGTAMANNPLASILGLGAGTDLATGSVLASQGKNVSSGAFNNLHKEMMKQIADKGDKAKSTIYQQLGTSAERFRKDPEKFIAGLSRDKKLDLMKSVSNIENATTPMTGTQYLLQKAQDNPASTLAKGRFGQVLSKIPKSLPKNKFMLAGIPASLISAWLLSKGAINTESARNQLDRMKDQLASVGK